MDLINHHKAKACLELGMKCHRPELGGDGLIRTEKYMCIPSFLYLLQDIHVDCLCIEETGLATNLSDIVGLLFTNLVERENDECNALG